MLPCNTICSSAVFHKTAHDINAKGTPEMCMPMGVVNHIVCGGWVWGKAGRWSEDVEKCMKTIIYHCTCIVKHNSSKQNY